MATKKKFYYYERNNTAKSISLAVLQLKNNSLKRIGICRYQKGSNKGRNSEVYEYLHSKKLVPVREYKATRGYYYSSNKGVKIEEI